MADTKYRLRYLPLFYEELEQKAILKRQPVAEAFEPYHSMKERKYPYYHICVNNFVIYYVVIDDEDVDKIMEVRRFLYNKQNRDKLV